MAALISSSLNTWVTSPSSATKTNERILVKHADAHLDGVLGGAQLEILAVQADVPEVGLDEARHDLHQRRLSGTVLAEQAVQRPGFDGEADAVVGANGPEVFVDVAQLESHRKPG